MRRDVMRIYEEVAAGRVTAEHGATILTQPLARKEMRAQLWLAGLYGICSGAFLTIGASEAERGEWKSITTILAGVAMAASSGWRIGNAIRRLGLSDHETINPAARDEET